MPARPCGCVRSNGDRRKIAKFSILDEIRAHRDARKLGRIAGRMATNDSPEAAPCASHVEHASAPSMTGSVGAIVRAQALARGYIARARATRTHVRDGNVEEHALEQAAVRAVRRASRPGAVAVGAAGGTRTRNGAFTSCSHADCVGRAHARRGLANASAATRDRACRVVCRRRTGATARPLSSLLVIHARTGRRAPAAMGPRSVTDAMPVPSDYAGVELTFPLTVAAATALFNAFRARRRLHAKCAGAVARAAGVAALRSPLTQRCVARVCAPSVCVQVRAAATAGVEQNPGAGQRSQAIRAAWAAADHRGGPAWPV